MYWAKSTCVPAISETMSRNRFEDVLRVLHFNDNALHKERGEPGYNRIYKLQPLIDKLRKNFKEKVLPETYHAIDEMMVAFKGRHGLKQYMQKKTQSGATSSGADQGFLDIHTTSKYVAVKLKDYQMA